MLSKITEGNHNGYFEIKIPLLVAIEHRSVISLTVCRNVNSFVSYKAV